jgi:transposase
MVRRFLSRELKEKALDLSLQGVSDGEILEYLGISSGTMARVRKNYQETGDVVRIPTCSGLRHT